MELVNSHFLILDDDADLVHLARKVLEGVGMHAQQAFTIDQAFEAASQHAPHIIITDLDLGDKSGFEFIDRVRKTPALKSVPIIVMSAKNDAQSVHRAISLGANEYLLKPFQAPGLIAKVKKVLAAKSILRFEFPESELPPIKVTVPCTLTEAGEGGYRIEAAIRLAPAEPIQVENKLLEKLGVGEYPLRTTPRPPMLRQEGQYLNEAVSVGLPPPVLHKIRSTLKGR